MRVVTELKHRNVKDSSRSLKYGDVSHHPRRQRLGLTRKLTNTIDDGAKVDSYVERHDRPLEPVNKLLVWAASVCDAPWLLRLQLARARAL